MPRALTPSEIEAFRSELCEVAADRFCAEGFEAVTMRGLASALGVSAMTPYRYFASKAELYREVRARAFLRFGERVAAAERREADPLDRLRALFAAYLSFAVENPGAYRIMFELRAPAQVDPDDDEKALADATWLPLLRTLEQAVAEGILRGDPQTLANLCWVQAHGLASLQIADRLRFDRGFDELLGPVFESLLHGILTRPAEGISP